jgi:hypothetical protein
LRGPTSSKPRERLPASLWREIVRVRFLGFGLLNKCSRYTQVNLLGLDRSRRGAGSEVWVILQPRCSSCDTIRYASSRIIGLGFSRKSRRPIPSGFLRAASSERDIDSKPGRFQTGQPRIGIRNESETIVTREAGGRAGGARPTLQPCPDHSAATAAESDGLDSGFPSS